MVAHPNERLIGLVHGGQGLHVGNELGFCETTIKVCELEGAGSNPLGTVASISASKLGNPQVLAMTACSGGAALLCRRAKVSVLRRASAEIERAADWKASHGEEELTVGRI